MNGDPRIELVEIGIGIGARRLRRGAVLGIRLRSFSAGAGSEAHDQQAGVSEKAPAMGAEDFFDLFGNYGGGAHATASFAEDGRASAMALAARLIAI